MALRKEAKRVIVAAVHEIAQMAQAAVVAEYRGLTAAELTQLRASARTAGVSVQVIRNTLSRRALEGTVFACLQSTLSGPLLFAFSLKEPSTAARLLQDFAKIHEKLVVKQLAFEGQLMGAKDLAKLANLPTRREALARFIATMRAPVEKLAHTMGASVTQLVRLLAALHEKRQQTEIKTD